MEVIGPEPANASVRLRCGESLVIGSGRDVDLRVKDACVSQRHCALDATGQGLLLVDLSSKNGVYVGNVRVDSAKICGKPTTFMIGMTTITVRGVAAESNLRDRAPVDGLCGQSEPMLRLKREIRRVAKLRAPVLIVGESGAGKDIVARALHGLSERRGPYLPINMATVPETLADSELFGHSKGAFTGAAQARIGAFEQAHEGTLFLDEVGELAPCVQAKMLRVLEDGIIRPIGASDARKVDVRIVSATWASLQEMTSLGRFRFDLLQRLSVMVLEVPPLRDRRSDIPELVQHWLRHYRAEIGHKRLSEMAVERLHNYDWPGNVRELGGVVYRACVMSDNDVVEAVDIARAMTCQGARSVRALESPEDMLVQAGGNVSEAARRAGLPRTTFRTWLRRAKRETSKKLDNQ